MPAALRVPDWSLTVNDPIDRLLTLIEQELGVDRSDLAPDSLLADLADSLDWAALMSAVEQQFGLRIDMSQGLRLRTVADLIALVAQPHRVLA